MNEWRKSSYSLDNGTCVEWRKSTRSAAAGECVEVADRPAGMDVRDSKDPHGPVLSFDAVSWRDFVAGINAGEFDR